MWSRLVRGLQAYVDKLRRFQRNARLYLLSTVLLGVTLGIFRLLFNFYVKSLGQSGPGMVQVFNEELIGWTMTASSSAALVGAVPAGYLGDILGRKISLLLSSALVSLAVLGLVFWRDPVGFIVLNGVIGLGQSLAGVSAGPFLMENSREEERTYLFAFNSGLQTLAQSLGNWFGGRLPGQLGLWLGVPATSTTAYAWAIALMATASMLALLPLALLHRPPRARSGRDMLAPFSYAFRRPVLLSKLIAPQLIIGLGAGLLIPFMNLFFRQTYGRSDAEIGSLFAWGSLAMGIGLLLAPPLADRFGKMRFVVVTQALSIPFLVLLGFSPWYGLSALAYLVRVALMNMSGPVYSTFVMEQVESKARATVASLVSMTWNLGWAAMPALSGWIQVQWGFGPVFGGTISTYAIAIGLMWLFFVRKKPGGPERTPIPAPEA